MYLWTAAVESKVAEDDILLENESNSLDLGLVGTVGGLFINDHSPRADCLKNSDLAGLAGDTILDPRDFEGSNEILVLRNTIDRSNEHDVLCAIEKNYGIEKANFERITKLSTLV